MDKLKKLYIDMPSWCDPISVDDFIVAVGVKKSNSVYHVASVKVGRLKDRVQRFHIQVYKTDLLTALKRESDQKLITIKWYSRKKNV